MEDLNKIWIGSFDIGKKNFSFYIEEFNVNLLNIITNIPKNERYNIDGTTTSAFKEILRNVCINGKTILFKNSDLTHGCVKGKYLDPEIFYNLTDLLDEYREYWDKCTTFVLEQQMSFGKRHNTMALKIGQHCYSYFIFNYSRFKNIVEFPSYHKTQVLGAQKIEKITKTGKITYKAIDKNSRKKWSVEKATSILAEREDFITMSELVSKKKKDDLADVITQLQAYKYLAFVDKSI
jgi:hypothetical protein